MNNCGQYRAIKEIPLPFALSEEKTDLLSDEDERVSILSNKMSRQDTNTSVNHSLVPAIMIPVSRHPSYSRHSTGPESVNRGSFYGRRDFENKHDDSAEIGVGSINNTNLHRKPSTLDNVLTKIKSMRNSDNSDESEVEDDDDYYYDGLED